MDESNIDVVVCEKCDIKSFKIFLCFVGEISYMSKKKYNKKVYNVKSNDIWSLGVCMYSIICGSAPYLTPDMSDPQVQV